MHLKSGISLLFLLLLFGTTPLFAQQTQVTFGQNRVQYKHFEWSFYTSDNFVTYFYLGGQDIGKFVVQYAEEVKPEVEKLLEYRLSRPVEILVYNDLSDQNQTNIGLPPDQYNVGGATQVIENKVFVYFNGNHRDLMRQIREGIARVILSHLLFGGNFQEVLQNAVMLNLPFWFTEGLSAYVAEGWTALHEERLRDGILSEKFKKFNNLDKTESRFVGHALWHYVAEIYGKSSVPNLLYITRINRSIESGFMFVLGGSVSQIMKRWHEYNLEKFTAENENKFTPADSLMLLTRWRDRKLNHFAPAISPNGKLIAYATDNLGQKRIRILNTETSKNRRILKYGIKTNTILTGNEYPQLTWSRNGETLAAAFEKRDKVKLLLYNPDKKKKDIRPVTKFQQLTGIAFTQDPRVLVLSGVNIGQSDIYLYTIPSTKLDQLTNDFWDDLEPSYFKNETHEGILFISNRPNDSLIYGRIDSILPKANFDVFFYDLKKQGRLIRITNTPALNERQPAQFDEQRFSFLGEENGIYNRFVGVIDSVLSHYDNLVYFRDSTVKNPSVNIDSILAIPGQTLIDSVFREPIYKRFGRSFPVTNYRHSILNHDVKADKSFSMEHFLYDHRHAFYVSPHPDSVKDSLKLDNSSFRNYLLNLEQKEQQKKEERKKLTDRSLVELPDIDEPVEVQETFFQTEFEIFKEAYFFDSLAYSSTMRKEPVFRFSKVLPYRVKFSTDYVVTQMDNSLLVTGYQKFAPEAPELFTPDLSGLIALGISDLMEDHKIIGGFRFPTNLKGSEYFLSYQALKKRLDKRFLYYRRRENRIFTDKVPFTGVSAPIGLPIEAKMKTNLFEYSMTYPIDVVRSIRPSFAYRHDTWVFTSKERISHRLNNYNDSWIFARLDYVHDQVLPLGINLPSGLRFKLFGEIHKQIQYTEKRIGGDFNLKLPKFNNGWFGVIGVDARHYQKIHKNIVFANRFAAGSSFGRSRVLYFLGGVDSWMTLRDRFDRSIPVPQDENIAFQAAVTNMRGFRQNIRNGSNYAVWNSELRVPIFSYLINSPIRSEFIKNFQVAGFFDSGTAWSGKNPFSLDQPLFTDIIDKDPILVEVNYYRNPIVYGYGMGLRSMLFGFFVRLDFAWGIDSGQREKPMTYLSLSLDF